jgi:omega-amidase
MNSLHISTIQTALFWEDVDRNLNHFDEKINVINQATDIIVLPEMFTTGFTMNPEKYAEIHGGKGLQWMLQKAKEKNVVIVGSISAKENNCFYNRLYWAKPDGSYEYYDKHHLFSMGKESQHYTAGHKKLIVEYNGWKICLMVCYDLRFPVWCRNSMQNPYDLLIFVANWPEVRVYAWKHLLIARAIENQAYVVGLNRVGTDGNNINHSGDSVVLNPKGEAICHHQSNTDNTEDIMLSYEQLQEFRKTFPVLLYADKFKI